MLPMKLYKKKLLTGHSANLDGLTSQSIMPASLHGLALQPNVSLEDWKKVIDINLTGTWLGMKYQIPAIIQSGGGSIVNMTSVAALMTFEGYSPYSASKWGIVGITKVAAKEYASKGVRVNAIAPGSIATPLFQDVINSTPNSKEDYQKQVPMNRIAESSEVASVVSFLCSDAASYITGAVLPVDGGMTL